MERDGDAASDEQIDSPSRRRRMKNDEGGVPRRKIEEESDKGTTLWKIDKFS